MPRTVVAARQKRGQDLPARGTRAIGLTAHAALCGLRGSPVEVGKALLCELLVLLRIARTRSSAVACGALATPRPFRASSTTSRQRQFC